MNEPNHPTEPPEPEPGDLPPEEERPALLWRVLKSAIAPDVLEDGGHDAPLTPRGRILFWGTIIVLTVAVVILFVVTLANR
jgi:hypothetical protein